VALLALAFNRTGRPQQALAVLRRFPHFARNHCEQTVHALIELGVDHYEEALTMANRCLETFPTSLLLLEFRTALYFSSGQRDLAEADLARMVTLGAPQETLDRLRALRQLRAPGPSH
jgi:hypothetical protein